MKKLLIKNVVLRCRIKVNCPHTGFMSTGGVSSLLVLLRGFSPYLRKFRRKPRKTPNGYVKKWRQDIEPDSSHLPALRCEPLGH